jgi:hypothetical protein
MTGKAKPDWGLFVPILREVIFANRIYMTEREQQVLLFIYQRTRMYGKEWESIPLRHFTKGVCSRTGGGCQKDCVSRFL